MDEFLRETIGLPTPPDWWSIDSAAPSCNSSWRSALAPPRRDPLAIDLDGDGIETIGAASDGSMSVVFDHNADGLLTGTGWLTADDAWLVRDLDGNGSIDSGRELFGVDTLIDAWTYIDGNHFHGLRNAFSGFEALSELDTGTGAGTSGDRDGVFDLRDAAFGELRLWRDLDGDGVSGGGELAALADHGIAAISLADNGVSQDLGNGNRITGSAIVHRSHGSSIAVAGVDLGAGNLDLVENPFYRQFPDTISFTPAAAALPEMGGSGWLRDLREAMSLANPGGEALLDVIGRFAAASSRHEQIVLLDELLLAWAGSSGRLNQRWAHEGAAAEQVGGVLLDADMSTKTTRYTTTDSSSWADAQRPDVVVYQFQDMALRQEATELPWHAPTEAGWKWIDRRNVLEVFNGQRFFGFDSVEPQLHPAGGGDDGDGSGGGAAGLGPTGPRARWVYTVSKEQVAAIDSAYTALGESVFQALVIQTRLRPYLDAIDVVFEEDSIRFDTAAMHARLLARQAESPSAGLADLIDLVRLTFPTLEAVGCAEFPSLSWLASTPGEALAGIRAVVAASVRDMAAHGEAVPEPIADRRYSGEFKVRIPPQQHRRLVIEASEQGVGLNRLVSAKLAR
jgi:predicted HicB family RNase H-like nuclease